MQLLGLDSEWVYLVAIGVQAKADRVLSDLEVVRVLKGDLDRQLQVDRVEHADVQGENLATFDGVGQDQVSKKVLGHQEVGAIRHHCTLSWAEKLINVPFNFCCLFRYH